MITEKLQQIQNDIALMPKGRFIPYIGKEYESGLSCSSGKPKILVIGLAHYCDARFNSRNILAFLTKDMFNKLSTGKSFPKELKVGCVLKSAKDCLRIIPNGCPVFNNSDTCECPLSENCTLPLLKENEIPSSDIYDKKNIACGGKRNLRCETLLAVNDYLGGQNIESARRAMGYFDQIKRFIIRRFKPHTYDPKYIFDRISFFNIIQKYEPLQVLDDSKLNSGKINSEYLEFAEYVISELVPDVIITTMKRVTDNLKSLLTEKLDFKLDENNEVLGYSTFISPAYQNKLGKEWQEILKLCIESYEFPRLGKDMGGDLKGMIEELASSKFGENIGKKKNKNIRDYLYKLLVEKAKNEKEPFPYVRKKFMSSEEKPYSGMRKWIDNNKSPTKKGRQLLRNAIEEFNTNNDSFYL